MSNNMHNRNESHTSLVSLPIELIIHILQEVYVPWTATMSLTCQLAPIPNIALLRTCSLFNFHDITAIHSAFSGEFVRHDRRGCIIDANLEPRKWYSWIMANTRTLNLHDAYFTIWYIPTYWQFYPRLKRFVLSIGQESTYNDPTIEMPDFEDRRRRCDQRTGTLIKRDYSFHGYLFDELFVSIFKDMQKAGGRQWPEVEYRFWDCRCHPKRQTVSSAINHAASTIWHADLACS